MLEQVGCRLLRHGARHREINEILAKKILKSLQFPDDGQ